MRYMISASLGNGKEGVGQPPQNDQASPARSGCCDGSRRTQLLLFSEQELLEAGVSSVIPVLNASSDPTLRQERLPPYNISPAERYSQIFTQATGSWGAIMTYSAACVGWAAFNLMSRLPVDPYPFTFLNFILSASAALSAPVILISQNADRKSELRRMNEVQEEQLRQASDLLEVLQLSSTELPPMVCKAAEDLRRLMERAKAICSSADRPDSQRFSESLTKGLGKFFGSWVFLGAMSGAIGAWLGGNFMMGWLDLNPIDPPPYLFLNLALSFISAFSAPVVVLSQQYEERVIRERAEIYDHLARNKQELVSFLAGGIYYSSR